MKSLSSQSFDNNQIFSSVSRLSRLRALCSDCDQLQLTEHHWLPQKVNRTNKCSRIATGTELAPPESQIAPLLLLLPLLSSLIIWPNLANRNFLLPLLHPASCDAPDYTNLPRSWPLSPLFLPNRGKHIFRKEYLQPLVVACLCCAKRRPPIIFHCCTLTCPKRIKNKEHTVHRAARPPLPVLNWLQTFPTFSISIPPGLADCRPRNETDSENHFSTLC